MSAPALARPGFVADRGRFLLDMVVVSWRGASPDLSASFTLTDEVQVLRDLFFLGVWFSFDWAKSLLCFLV